MGNIRKSELYRAYLQGRNRDADAENRFSDTGKEGVGRIERVALICIHFVVVIQLLSHVRLCDCVDCSTLAPLSLHHLPEFVQTHVP